MPLMRHNISANRMRGRGAISGDLREGQTQWDEYVLLLRAAVFPVADAGGAQADVNLRRRQVAASPMCAGSATLQLMVHTALATISTKSRRQYMA